jgi:hypothetical protein
MNLEKKIEVKIMAMQRVHDTPIFVNSNRIKVFDTLIVLLVLYYYRKIAISKLKYDYPSPYRTRIGHSLDYDYPSPYRTRIGHPLDFGDFEVTDTRNMDQILGGEPSSSHISTECQRFVLVLVLFNLHVSEGMIVEWKMMLQVLPCEYVCYADNPIVLLWHAVLIQYLGFLPVYCNFLFYRNSVTSPVFSFY